MIEINIYEEELKQILRVWVFGFTCANCTINESHSSFNYITPETKGDHDAGIYPSPPTLWCGCNESLYNIKSHGLYELFESLYGKNKHDNIIIKSYDDEETPSTIPDDFTFTQTENI